MMQEWADNLPPEPKPDQSMFGLGPVAGLAAASIFIK